MCVYFCVCMLTIQRKWQINSVFGCVCVCVLCANENELRNAMSSGRTALCHCLQCQKQELIIYYRFFLFIDVFPLFQPSLRRFLQQTTTNGPANIYIYIYSRYAKKTMQLTNGWCVVHRESMSRNSIP